MSKIKLSPPLYHYTTLEAAVSILNEGKLRLYRSTALSDPLEERLGLDMLVDVLIEALDKATDTKQRQRLGSVLLQTYLVFSMQGDSRFTPELRQKMGMPKAMAEMTHFVDTFGPQNPDRVRAIYVACLTEERDAIGQWRLYGDSGAGVALGFKFDKDIKKKSINGRKVKVGIGQVSYDKEKVRRKMQALGKRIAASSSNIWSLAEMCYQEAILLKQADYSHEREWRLFIYAKALKHSPNVTISRGRIRPYVDLESFGLSADNKLPLVEIITGPLSAFDGETDEHWRLFVYSKNTIDAADDVRLTKSGKMLR